MTVLTIHMHKTLSECTERAGSRVQSTDQIGEKSEDMSVGAL